MAINLGGLTSTLNQTKLAKDNNALYQYLKTNVQVLQDIIDAIGGSIDSEFAALIASSRVTKFVEPRTTSGPKTVILSDDVPNSQRAVVVKDIDGNAAANNITLQGTVDGVANPVINTNFGVFRVYKSSVDGAYHEW